MILMNATVRGTEAEISELLELLNRMDAIIIGCDFAPTSPDDVIKRS